jgi:hypothetical protein
MRRDSTCGCRATVLLLTIAAVADGGGGIDTTTELANAGRDVRHLRGSDNEFSPQHLTQLHRPASAHPHSGLLVASSLVESAVPLENITVLIVCHDAGESFGSSPLTILSLRGVTPFWHDAACAVHVLCPRESNSTTAVSFTAHFTPHGC